MLMLLSEAKRPVQLEPQCSRVTNSVQSLFKPKSLKRTFSHAKTLGGLTTVQYGKNYSVKLVGLNDQCNLNSTVVG